MNKNLLFVLVPVLVLALVYTILNISLNNRSNYLRNLANAQQDICMTVRDTMFNTIRDQYKIKTEYSQELKDLVEAEMTGRYSQGQPRLMSWISEQNPTIDVSVTNHLMTTIEAQRANFQVAQRSLRSVKNEHDTLVMNFPGSFFIANKEPIKVTMVYSTETSKVYETGRDDEDPLKR